MSPTDRIIAFRPDEDLLIAMEVIQKRDGIALSEQIRRALRFWLCQDSRNLPDDVRPAPVLSARQTIRAIKKRYEGKVTDRTIEPMNPKRGR